MQASSTVRSAQLEAEQRRQRERAKAKERKKRRSSTGAGEDESKRGGGGGGASRKKKRGSSGVGDAGDDDAQAASRTAPEDDGFIAFSRFGSSSAQAELDEATLHQQELVDEVERADKRRAAAAAVNAPEGDDDDAAEPEEASAEEPQEAEADDDVDMQDVAAPEDADDAAAPEEEVADEAEAAEEPEEEEVELASSASEEDDADAAAGSDDEIAVDVVDPSDEEAEASADVDEADDVEPMSSPIASDEDEAPVTPAPKSRKRPSAAAASASAAAASVAASGTAAPAALPSIRLSSFSFHASQVSFDAERRSYILRMRAGERITFRGSVAFEVEEGFLDVAGHTFNPRSSRVRSAAASAGGDDATASAASNTRTSVFHAHSWSWQPHALLSLCARAPATGNNLHGEFVTTVRLSACTSRFAPQRMAQLVAAHAAGESLATSKPWQQAGPPSVLAADPYSSSDSTAATAATPRKQSAAASKRQSKKGSAKKAAGADAMDDADPAVPSISSGTFVQLTIPGFTPVLFSDDDFRPVPALASSSAVASADTFSHGAAAAAPKTLYNALQVPAEWEEAIKSMLQPLVPLNPAAAAASIAAAAAADDDDAEGSTSAPAIPLTKAALLARKLHSKALRHSIQTEGLRILLWGARNAGKSSALVQIANAALNRFGRVLILDLDVGQSMLNPPGMIGLHEVTAPLLSSSPHVYVGRGAQGQGHSSSMLWSHFVGDVTVTSGDPLATLHAAQVATAIFTSRFGPASGSPSLTPLLVNTPGWLTGLGLDLVQRVVKEVVKPVYVVEVKLEKMELESDAAAAGSAKKPRRKHAADAEGESTAEAEESVLGEIAHAHKVVTLRRSVDPAFASSVAAAGMVVTAPRMRQLQLLAYFTSGSSSAAASPVTSSLPFCFASYASLLSSLAPYAVPFAGLRVEVQGLDPVRDYAPAAVPGILNGSIVALCISPVNAAAASQSDVVGSASGMRLVRSSASSLPLFHAGSSPPPAMAQCLGLGLVRAVDPLKRLVYIVTPLSSSAMSRVNLLQKGRLDTPQGAYGKDEYAAACTQALQQLQGAQSGTQQAAPTALPYLSTSTLSASSGFGARQMSSRHNLQRKRLQ